jgi:hypothetical protein
MICVMRPMFCVDALVAVAMCEGFRVQGSGFGFSVGGNAETT